MFRSSGGAVTTSSPMSGSGGAGRTPVSGTPNTSSTFDPRVDAYQDAALPRGPPATEQEIVPQLLIDHFVSMVDPSRAQTVDSDIARHCAFSLPAVALTLGRSNWPLLKDTYAALACDMQWKVRRTLASSIHELGVILGPECSATDLIPIFNGFLKDLDEVRIGLLKHLGDFLKLLDEDVRRQYLPKLQDFLKMDNDRNWRFRLELTEQLEKLLPLYSPSDVDEHISPMVMVLIRDKVAAVRRCATSVLAAILYYLSRSDNPELAQGLVRIIVEAQALDSHWVHRQTFAALVYTVHDSCALQPAQIAESLLPPLLELSEDKVANVRLAVARTLSSINAETDFFKNNESESAKLPIDTVEMNLKNDVDVDVRIFYGGEKRLSGGAIEGSGDHLGSSEDYSGDGGEIREGDDHDQEESSSCPDAPEENVGGEAATVDGVQDEASTTGETTELL